MKVTDNIHIYKYIKSININQNNQLILTYLKILSLHYKILMIMKYMDRINRVMI